MSDILQDEFDKSVTPGMTEFQIFQIGWSKASVSMRARAQKVAQAAKTPDNDVINGIGSLPDVPSA